MIWSLEDFKADSDWKEAVGSFGRPSVAMHSDASHASFGIDDVARVVSADSGQNDGDHWVCVVELADGRFAFVDAWCDYTGWDCQSGGSAIVSHDLASLVRYGLTDEARDRLELKIGP